MKNIGLINRQMWAMYFAGIVAFQYHPKNSENERLTIGDCAKVADEMMVETYKRFEGDKSWDGWPLPK